MTLVEKIKERLLNLDIPVEGSTIQEIYAHLATIKIPKLMDPITGHETLAPFTINTIQFSNIQRLPYGSYTLLYLALRNNTDTVFLKTYKAVDVVVENQKTIFFEGILQSIAQVTLDHFGFSYAVPKVLDIKRNSDCGYFISIEDPKAKVLSEWIVSNFTHNAPNSKEHNDKLIVQILIQLATYLHILQTEVKMDHRDVKESNILMIRQTEPYTKHIQIGSKQWSFTSTLQTILIDFGLACVGTSDKKIAIATREIIPTFPDKSPREERDIFFFLLNLWNKQGFHESISFKLKTILRNCLTWDNGIQWWSFLEQEREDNPLAFYSITGGDGHKSRSSKPLVLLQVLAKEYPELIQMG